MTKEEEEVHQPPLTLTHKSYVKGELEGKPCVVIYDAATDKTTVISSQSKWYANAMAAIDILDAASTPIPLKKRTVIHKVTKPKLILPGSTAAN